MSRIPLSILVILALSGCGGPDCSEVADPSLPGPFGVVSSRTDLTLEVEGDAATVPVTILMPDVSGVAPLVIFTHGFSQEPAAYIGTGEFIASWGMVVVMPSIPGGIFSPVPHRIMAEYLRGVLDWAVGAGNAADGPLAGHVDPGRVGLAGHSMGGKLSFLLAASDERVDAVFGVDPVDAGPPMDDYDPVDWPSVTPELMPGIEIPIVALGQTLDGELSDSLSCAPAGNRFSDYYDAAVGPAVQIEVIGADHLSFLDACDEFCSLLCRSGTDDPTVTLALTRKYLVAFFRENLLAETCLRDWLAGDAMRADIDAGRVLAESKNGY
ncbi:hypothetical protein KBA39_10750 [Myxococcota bacterium]|nr:hypothetical protein [Myxococcota bacterium]